MITLDGSTLEGGGQLVRVALSLSSIVGVPVRITNIRANRARRGRVGQQGNHHSAGSANGGDRAAKDGGLKESHLAALHWLARQCSASVSGDSVGSREVVFRPQRRQRDPAVVVDGPRAAESVVALARPGSVWLIWQAIYPYIVFRTLFSSDASFEVRLQGGTNVSKSMSAEYVQQVFGPVCEKIGLPRTEVQLLRRGWAGNAAEVGNVNVKVQRRGNVAPLPAVKVQDRGDVVSVAVSIVAHGGLREKIKVEVHSQLSRRMPGIPIETVVDDDSGDERRVYVLLVAHTSGGWRLGRDYLGGGAKARNTAEQNKRVEHAVAGVVGELSREVENGGCVDEFMQDQLVVFQALAGGESVVDAGMRGQGSLHARTVRWVCRTMLAEEGCEFEDGGRAVGIGWDGRQDMLAENMRTLEVRGGME